MLLMVWHCDPLRPLGFGRPAANKGTRHNSASLHPPPCPRTHTPPHPLTPQGAATTIFACTAPELEAHSGAYLADCQVGATAGGFWGRRMCRPSKLATDAELAKQLWVKTEVLIQEALQQA